jgi:hypothetical protein
VHRCVMNRKSPVFGREVYQMTSPVDQVRGEAEDIGFLGTGTVAQAREGVRRGAE